MKKTIQLLLFLGLAVLSTGCASPYMVDRGRDAADIFTIAVGVGVGAKGRAGPATVGVCASIDVVGIRNGILLDPLDSNVDLQSTIVPLPPCVADRPPYLCFGFEALQVRCPALSEQPLGMLAYSEFPFITTSLYSGEDDAPQSARWKYWTQVDVVAALGPSVRLGFNSGELLDFILGWTTIDIYNDDLEKRKSNKPLQATPQ